MYFDRRYQPPMKFRNIRNSKKIIIFTLILAPKFSLYRMLGYEQIVLKNIFCYYTAPKASNMLHTKKQIKKAINLEERAQKLKNHVFSGFQAPSGSFKDPNFHFNSVFRYDQIVTKNIFCY